MGLESIVLIEPFSGVSGDMFVGALIDAGADFAQVQEQLRRLPLSGYRVGIRRCVRAGIQATKFDVEIEEATHDHHHGHHHDHVHRRFRDIRQMIETAGLSPWVTQKSLDAFTRLAVAEGRVHGVPPDEVSFHEVGAVDSIVDIIGAMIAAEQFMPARFVSTAVNVGRGTLKCQHGIYPVPGPAAQDLLQGIPTYSNEVEGELTTPTGAALLVSLASEFTARPTIVVRASGYGAGTRDMPGNANVLRITVGDPLTESQAASPEHQVAVIDATIDDMNPQVYGYFQDKALKAGALDVYATPAQMKKNRPGLLITVICPVSLVEPLSALVFAETTTIGIRYMFAQRKTLERRFERVQTSYGEVAIKVSLLDGRRVNFVPEYEDCRCLAENNNVPLKEVLAAATQAYLTNTNRA
jgi:pyridinium-3,5-bisthiocarboxylic acid mononucleotide nickel chelatase